MVEVTGVVALNEALPGGAEVVEPAVTALTEPALAPPTELWRPTFGAACRRASTTRRYPAPPAAPSSMAARERLDGGLPVGPRRAGLHRDRHAQAVGIATESGANVFTVD